MYPIKKLDSSSLLKVILFGLAQGIFTAGLIYMVDWKLNELMPFYAYILLVLVFPIINPIIAIIVYKYNKEKQGES